MKLNSKIFTFAILTAGITGAASANPIIDVYAGGTFGVGGTAALWDGGHKNEAAQSFGGVFGIDIPLIRIEAEYNHIRNDLFSTNEAMLNAYFKMLSTLIHPYFGVGVGSIFGGHVDTDNTKYDVKTSVAYQGMLGVTFDILAMPFAFDVEGRVLYSPNFVEIGTEKPDMLQYDARAKVRYLF